jgi:predicted protein tyrosine phosphatase
MPPRREWRPGRSSAKIQFAVEGGLMPTIHVCPLHAVTEVVMSTGAGHLLSVINRETIPATPSGVARHLRLGFHDITIPQPGLIHPNAEHVEEILEFAWSWDRRSPMVVHCWAGISRSTAAAFITMCALNPEAEEAAIARMIRARSPTATPNALMVELADVALRRRGRMVSAIEEIGPGELAMEGQPFMLDARHTDASSDS